MEELSFIKKQLSFIYLLLSILYLTTIFNFSLWIHFNRNARLIGDNLSTQQLVDPRLLNERLVVRRSVSALEQQTLDAKQPIHQQNELNFNKASKKRLKRDLNDPFNLPDLSKVWSNEDETLKQKLINNRYLASYELMLNDDPNPIASPDRRERFTNEDKSLSSTADVQQLPLAPSHSHSQARSTRHRSHHQKRRLTTTTDQPIDQEQSVEFFAQPQQNTGNTNGKVWVNSYSRVPVSFLFVCFFQKKKLNF